MFAGAFLLVLCLPDGGMLGYELAGSGFVNVFEDRLHFVEFLVGCLYLFLEGEKQLLDTLDQIVAGGRLPRNELIPKLAHHEVHQPL